MKPDQITRLYNKQYASTYNEKFLFSDLAKQDTEFEVQILKKLLNQGGPWLDVACGTGYFLGQFPQVERAGLDLSPAMLEIARKENPGVPFYRRDCREEIPQWDGRWSLVSCMWYAYALVDSMSEVKSIIKNLACWTSDQGICFLPVCDPELVSGVNFPYEVVESPWPGRVMVTGILWSYIESPEEHHENIVVPQVQYLVEMFDEYFDRIDMIEYPLGRRAIVARKKKAQKRV